MSDQPKQPNQETSHDEIAATAAWPPPPGQRFSATGTPAICVTATQTSPPEAIVLAVLPEMPPQSCYVVWSGYNWPDQPDPVFLSGDYCGSLPKALDLFDARVASRRPREAASR